MKKFVFCLSLLVLGAGPLVSQAQENSWAISLSAAYGFDLEQSGGSPGLGFPLGVATPFGLSEVQPGSPWALQLGLHIPLGKRLGLETGAGFLSRSIQYQTLYQDPPSGQCLDCRAGIGVRMYRVPVLLDWTPLEGSGGAWKLHVKAGLSLDWTGVPDDVFYTEGPASLETPSKVEVVDLYQGGSYMFLITDETFSGSALAGLEWEQDLGKAGSLGLGLTFAQQLNSSTSLLVWGYNRELDNRVGGYFPSGMQFSSLLLHARYKFRL
jgi:hypothetical protein